MNCKIHGIKYINGLDNNYQSTNQYFCTECIKESENNNLLLERTFITFLSKSYFITAICILGWDFYKYHLIFLLNKL